MEVSDAFLRVLSHIFLEYRIGSKFRHFLVKVFHKSDIFNPVVRCFQIGIRINEFVKISEKILLCLFFFGRILFIGCFQSSV